MISIGMRSFPNSMTRSTSSPVVARQNMISARSSRASRQARRSFRIMFSRYAPEGFGRAREVERHAGVRPVQLGRFDESLGSVDRERMKPCQEIRRLQQVQIAARGRLRQRDVAPDFGLVQELSESVAGGERQSAKVRQRGYGGQLKQVAFQISSYVAVEPDVSFAVFAHLKRRRRESAAPRRRAPVFGRARLFRKQVAPVRVAGGEQLFPHAAPSQSHPLAPRHGPQREIARSVRQRLRHARHERQIRRPGDEKAPRLALAVYRAFHGVEQRRLSLNFVKRYGALAFQKGVRIAPRHVRDVQIIEREEIPLSRHQLARKRAFPRLPRPRDDHRGHGAQTLFDAFGCQSWECKIIHAVNDNRSRRELQFSARRERSERRKPPAIRRPFHLGGICGYGEKRESGETKS